MHVVSSSSLLRGFVLALVVGGGVARAAELPVVAVVACDAYGELIKQAGWVGIQVGNPALPLLIEGSLAAATQGKGLNGLDRTRPLGIVVSADGDMPVVHGYLPIKDLDKLLETLQGVLGPATKEGDKRIVSPPGGLPLEIVERDGWAIVSPQGAPAGPADPAALIAKLTDAYSLAAEIFPARMPEGMREQLRQAIAQGGQMAAAGGQAFDPAVLLAGDEALAQAESLTLGVAVDVAKDRVFVESRTVMVPGSEAAAVWDNAGSTADALALPAAGDGKPAAIRAHHAQAVPAEARPGVQAALLRALPIDGGDPLTAAIFGLVRDLAEAMLDTGGIDTGLAVDTSGTGGDTLVPAITISARIADGPGLETRVKERLGKEGALPPGAKARFDAGKAAGANLHEIELDLAGTPLVDTLGEKLVITLAVTPDRGIVLVGGDVPARVKAAVEAAGGAEEGRKPLTGVDVSLASLMAYAAAVSQAAQPDDPTAAILAAVAKKAADLPSTLVQLLVRPIKGGVAMRLSADAGAVRTIASAVNARPPVTPAGPPAGGLPLPGGAPALAP